MGIYSLLCMLGRVCIRLCRRDVWHRLGWMCWGGVPCCMCLGLGWRAVKSIWLNWRSTLLQQSCNNTAAYKTTPKSKNCTNSPSQYTQSTAKHNENKYEYPSISTYRMYSGCSAISHPVHHQYKHYRIHRRHNFYKYSFWCVMNCWCIVLVIGVIGNCFWLVCRGHVLNNSTHWEAN